VHRRADRTCQTRGRGVNARERTTRDRTFSGLGGYVVTLSLAVRIYLSLSLSLSLSPPLHPFYPSLLRIREFPLIQRRSSLPTVGSWDFVCFFFSFVLFPLVSFLFFSCYFYLFILFSCLFPPPVLYSRYAHRPSPVAY